MGEDDILHGGGGAIAELEMGDTNDPNKPDDGKLNEIRLNSTVTPRHYDLHFTSIDLVKHTFEGVVTIDIDANAESQDSITLHALELNILEAKLFETKQAFGETNLVDDSLPADIYETIASANETYGTDVGDHPFLNAPVKTLRCFEGEEFMYNVRLQTCTIKFSRPTNFRTSFHARVPIIRPGTSYQLQISFAGVLNDQMHGLYRSTYTSMDGLTECIMASTHFEATNARRAFPCFDEPALKSTFQLTVTVPLQSPQTGRPMRCISNTPIIEEHTTIKREEDGTVDNLKTYKFDTTPKMSSYLVAVVLGEFDSISAMSAKTGIRTTIYTVPGKAHMAQFCLEVASKCLDLFSDLFDVPYPLQKSDLIAIPDFASGAMENWGCVTYREAKILVEEGKTSETMKRGIARTVCHELAHQWFGNLVTMEFWTQLWLKEGVARFMEFVGIKTIFPEWEAWTEFVQSVYGLALNLDALESSHPVEVEVLRPEQIKEIYNAISYAKGASIVRMIISLIGLDKFLKGMNVYMNRHAFANTTTPMLWEAFQEVSYIPVVDLMSPWTANVGYPVVILPDPEKGDPLIIRSPRFLVMGPSPTDEGDKSWPIPVTALVEGSANVQGPWIINSPVGDDMGALVRRIQQWSDAGRWFKLNVSQTGFYRVVYTEKQRERLRKVMSSTGPLPAVDRLGLLADIFAAGRAGYAPVVDALRVAVQFADEEEAEYTVWQELCDNLRVLDDLYRSEPFYPNFQRMLLHVYKKQMGILGWEEDPKESARTATLRSLVIRMLGIAGDETVIEECYRRFQIYMDNPVETVMSGDLRQVIFRNSLRKDEEGVYNLLKMHYERSTFPEEERNCLTAMSCVRDMERHKDMLNYVLFSGQVKDQDIAFPLNALVTSSDDAGRACWNYMKEEFTKLQAEFEGGPVWGTIVGLMCRGLKTEEEAQEVEAFFKDPSHPPSSGRMRLAQALEAIRVKAQRLERNKDALEEFLLTEFP